MSRFVTRWLTALGSPVALLVFVFVVWHFAVVEWPKGTSSRSKEPRPSANLQTGFEEKEVWKRAIPRYLVPHPADVLKAARDNSPVLLQAVGLTMAAALSGFGCSLVVGTLIACVFSQSGVIRRSCYPYAIFLQTVPIIAIAPLIVVWFGAGFPSVVLVSFIISLFPIITNGTTGLLAIDPDLLDLFRLYRASRWQVLWKLRLPHAVPFLVTGARTSSGLAVVGAIVGEFFAGYQSERHGLGYVILQTSAQLNTAKLFSAVIASTLLGLAIFGLSTWVGTTILSRWSDPARERQRDASS